MKFVSSFRKRRAKKIAILISFFFFFLIIVVVLVYNFSNVVKKPYLLVLLSILGGFLSSYGFYSGHQPAEPKKNKLKNDLTLAYGDVLDKSFLNPDKKIKKGQ